MLVKNREKDLERIGITFDDKGKVVFNVNQFTRKILSKCKMRCYKDTFYLYEEYERYWRELSEKELKKLIKETFEEADKNIWRNNYSNQSFESLVLSIKDMYKPNPNNYKLNLVNGVYNFSALKMEPHNEENYFTYIKEYELLEEEIPTPIFDKFIDELVLDREELKKYLLMVLAYLISGDKKLQKFFILKGEGANGKSTLINLITELIGKNYVTSISLSKLNEKFALSSAVGKRLIVASENENNSSISTETIKKLTGGDLVEIEQKYKDRYSDKLEVEVLFAVNNTVLFSENSYGLKRRLEVIPFDYRVEDADIDMELDKKLKTEIPYIMRKLIGIHAEFVKGGYKLPICEEVENAKKMFLDEGIRNSLGAGIFDFLEENITIDLAKRASKNDVYRAYVDSNVGSATSTKFWMDFDKWQKYKGYEIKQINSKGRHKVGITLKNTDKEKIEDIFI